MQDIKRKKGYDERQRPKKGQSKNEQLMRCFA